MVSNWTRMLTLWSCILGLFKAPFPPCDTPRAFHDKQGTLFRVLFLSVAEKRYSWNEVSALPPLKTRGKSSAGRAPHPDWAATKDAYTYIRTIVFWIYTLGSHSVRSTMAHLLRCVRSNGSNSNLHWVYTHRSNDPTDFNRSPDCASIYGRKLNNSLVVSKESLNSFDSPSIRTSIYSSLGSFKLLESFPRLLILAVSVDWIISWSK